MKTEDTEGREAHVHTSRCYDFFAKPGHQEPDCKYAKVERGATVEEPVQTEATLADRVRNETKRLQMQGVLFDAETFYAAKDEIERLTRCLEIRREEIDSLNESVERLREELRVTNERLELQFEKSGERLARTE